MIKKIPYILPIMAFFCLFFAKKTNEKAARRLVSKILPKPTLLEMQFQSLYDRIENCHCRFVFDSFLFKKYVNAKNENGKLTFASCFFTENR
jgi:hypothetical protein